MLRSFTGVMWPIQPILLADWAAAAKIRSMEVVVTPSQRVLNVQPGVNLLEALRDHSVPMSYSCMAGRCGTCRCRVTEGDVLDGGQEVRRPLDGESQVVLACQTFLTEPCTIEIPEPDEIVVHPARIVKATVVAIEDMTHDIKRLRLKAAKALAYSPGQYVHLQVTPDHVRPYSMAGLGHGNQLEFHVRLVPDGRVTGYIADTLRVGDVLRVSGPLGTAYLRRKHEGPMLCVAGGTGLAPILSIIRGAVADGMRNPIHLYFGVRSQRDVYGLEWIRQLQREHENLHLHVVVASGADPRQHRAGLVTDAIEADIDDLTGWRAYLCGSPPMVEAATLLAKRLGLPPDRVHADAFYTQGT
jgi:ferredoxin-NAD(P)+ reductase (naphthalene dioxygenase ferredoxin-specific)